MCVACLNSSSPAHRLSTTSSRPMLTADWKAEVARSYSTTHVVGAVRRLAAMCGMDHRDLLHDAVVRALDHGCGGQAADKRLIMCARSIASTHARSVHRASVAVTRPDNPGYAVSPFPRPDHALEAKQRAASLRARLRRVARGDVALIRLIDGMLDDLWGSALEERLGIDTPALATLRRRLKRRAGCELRGFV